MENILVGLFGWAITFPELNMGHQVDISGMQVYTRSGSNKGFPGGSAEKSMAPHSSTLAWKIPWTEEPGGLQSLGSRRVGHDWATSLSLFTFMHWRRKWQPTPVFLPGKIPGTGEPGGLPSMGSHRVGHNWSDLAVAAACLGLVDFFKILDLIYISTPAVWDWWRGFCVITFNFVLQGVEWATEDFSGKKKLGKSSFPLPHSLNLSWFFLGSYPFYGHQYLHKYLATVCPGEYSGSCVHVCSVTSVMSDHLWPYWLYPMRLLCLWGFSRQEYWSGLPCPPPGDFPDPGIEPGSPASAGELLTTSATWKAHSGNY